MSLAETAPEMAATSDAPATTQGRLSDLFAQGERFALVALTVGVALVFAFLPATSRAFPTAANLNVLLGAQVTVCLLAFALIIPLVAGAFDLSAGANLGLCAVVCAAAGAHYHAPLAVVVVAGILAGGLVGLVNAIAISIVRLDSFIVTLATSSVIGGAVIWYTHGIPIATGISPALVEFGTGRVAGIPYPAFVAAAAGLAAWFLLEHTPYGRRLRAIGANRRAAHLVGIRVNPTIFTALVIAGLVAGLGGVLSVAYLGAATLSTGPDLLFAALTAIFLGTTCISPGTMNIPGTVVGVMFVAVCVSGLNLMGVDSWVGPVFNGVALLFAVMISSYLRRQRRTEAL